MSDNLYLKSIRERFTSKDATNEALVEMLEGLAIHLGRTITYEGVVRLYLQKREMEIKPRASEKA